MKISKTRTPRDEYRGQWSYYAGAQAEYRHPDKLILFAGARFSTVKYQQVMLEIADATFTNNYRINYLELPFGLGYHLPAGKSLGITIYLGGFYNIGIAGKNKVFVQSYLPALSPGYIESWETKHIKFETEDGMQDDFRKTNGGWQTGLSFSFLKKWNLEALYKHGISNLLTKEEGKYEERRLRLFSLGVKYDLFSHPIKKRSPGASLKKAF